MLYTMHNETYLKCILKLNLKEGRVVETNSETGAQELSDNRSWIRNKKHLDAGAEAKKFG